MDYLLGDIIFELGTGFEVKGLINGFR